jgi:hypothetical protein
MHLAAYTNASDIRISFKLSFDDVAHLGNRRISTVCEVDVARDADVVVRLAVGDRNVGTHDGD